MNDTMDTLLTIVIAVIAFTALYKVLPFKVHKSEKPKLSFFPKYIAKFNKPINDIESSLSALEFKKNESGIYTRGKVYGDFSAKAIKLAVELDDQSKEIKVYASFFGIFFDTGDIWQLTSDIIGEQQP
tara:strand:- start:1350 stop:1733 length:384 start_codon:yes stop_codon:yes gene_type:complete